MTKPRKPWRKCAHCGADLRKAAGRGWLHVDGGRWHCVPGDPEHAEPEGEPDVFEH